MTFPRRYGSVRGASVIRDRRGGAANALRGLALHRVDLRLSKDFDLRGTVKLSGIAEVFNLLNHENYGAYTGQVDSASFGEPRQNLLNAYQPRVAQLAFRVTF